MRTVLARHSSAGDTHGATRNRLNQLSAQSFASDDASHDVKYLCLSTLCKFPRFLATGEDKDGEAEKKTGKWNRLDGVSGGGH